MPIASSASLASYYGDVAAPMEELSLLVDSVVVKQAVLAEFKCGILGYWPPELDWEVEFISNRIYLPHLSPTVVIVNGGFLKYKYLIVLLGEKFLLLALDKRVDAEKLGNKVLNIISGIALREFSEGF